MNIGKEIYQIKLADIIPNRFQPRINFDEKSINELADSIKQHGLIQPLVLRKVQDKYEIIAGERRYKAAQLLGLQVVPAIVVNLDDASSAEIAVVENIQRTALTPIEEAKAYQKLLEVGSLTQGQLASRMGKTQPTVANKLRLLNLDQAVQDALLNNQISERHARSLLTVKDPVLQRQILNDIITQRLTVRQTDDLIKSYLNPDSQVSSNVISNEQSNEQSNLEVNRNTVNLDNLNIDSPTIKDDPYGKTQILDINKLREDTNDVRPVEPTADIDALLKTETSNNTMSLNNEVKESNVNDKFFPSLEDLETNMNTNIDVSNTENKYNNFLDDTIDESDNNTLQKNEATERPTTFANPFDNFYTNLEEDKKDPELVNVEITPRIKNAINMTRDFVERLEGMGIHVELEEINLLKDYQFIIKITK